MGWTQSPRWVGKRSPGPGHSDRRRRGYLGVLISWDLGQRVEQQGGVEVTKGVTAEAEASWGVRMEQ